MVISILFCSCIFITMSGRKRLHTQLLDSALICCIVTVQEILMHTHRCTQYKMVQGFTDSFIALYYRNGNFFRNNYETTILWSKTPWRRWWMLHLGQCSWGSFGSGQLFNWWSLGTPGRDCGVAMMQGGIEKGRNKSLICIQNICIYIYMYNCIYIYINLKPIYLYIHIIYDVI